MKKTSCKEIPLLLILLSLLVLVGCGKEDTSITTPTTITNPTTITEPISTECIHQYGEWTSTKPASCDEDGEQTRVCQKCSNTETQPIAALGHTEVIDKGKKPTCTSTGLTEGKHCSVCNTTIVKQQVLEASHNDPHGICLECNKVTNETKAINHYFDIDTSYATGKYVKTYYDYSLYVEYYIMYIFAEISITNSYDGGIAVTIDFEIDGSVERSGPNYSDTGFMNYVIMLGDITVRSGHTSVHWGDAELSSTVFLDSIDELENYYGDGTFYINLGNYYL